MPAHNEFFRDFDKFEVQPPFNLSGDTRICLLDEGVQLRRLSSDELKFDPGGLYRESWIILPNWKAAGIQSLYGFMAKSKLAGQQLTTNYGGSLSYQLSNDNGITWLYHNGTAWVASGSTNWNTESEVDTWIPDFPLTSEKEIRIKVLLTPGNSGQSTPLLLRTSIFSDLDYNFQEDLLRSMKSWLETYVWLRTSYFSQIPQPIGGTDPGMPCPPSGPSDILYVTDRQWEELAEPASVYNLTTDPGKTTNLFAGFVDGGIQLISPQEGYLEANFYARPSVFIGAEEFMQLAKIPSIVVQLGNVKERRDLRRGEDEVDFAVSRLKAQRNVSRVWFDAEFTISSQSDLKHEAIQMCDFVDKALTHHQFVVSLQTGEVMPVPYATPMSPAHRVAQGLFVRDYSCTLFGKAWLRPELTVDRDLSTEVVFLAHPMDSLLSEEISTTEV